MTRFLMAFLLLAPALLCGCQAMPQAPTVTVQPGDARSPAEFRSDDVDCRQHASSGGPASDRRATVASGKEGSLIDGTDSAQYAGFGMQRDYNRAYVRCMYLKGNRVPLLARERWPAPRSTWPPDRDAYFLPLQP
jgi:hypothetical protein